MKQTPSPNPQPTLGFLTANIHVGVSRRLWLGVVDAAERLNANLICYPGGVLQPQTENADPAPANTNAHAFAEGRSAVYDLANPAMLDGIVNWASTITGTNSAAIAGADVLEESRALFARFSALPVVTLTQPQGDSHYVSVDSYAGMRAMMRHLIETHGYRRIAFIRGPSEHYYAQERFQAYLDALTEHDIPPAPELITAHYPFLHEAGGDAIAELLDQRALRPGIEIDAVAAVSDLLALGALAALRTRQIAVPRDLALVGFNDSTEARLATPPLTTVDMPFREQGALAVETLISLLRGADADPCAMLQSTLVVRQSCGCPSRSMALAGESATRTGIDPWAAIKQALAAELPGGAARLPALHKWQDTVADALRADIQGDTGHFLTTLEAALNWVAEGEESVRRWQDVLSILRTGLLASLQEPLQESLQASQHTRLENLIGQARVLVAEVAQRTLAVRQLREERQTAILREIGQALITTVDIDAITDILASRLPELGIRACFLSLYNEPVSGMEPTARLALGYTEAGRITQSASDASFPANQLAPCAHFPLSRRASWVVEPLFFRESRIGFVLFEVGPHDTAIYEVLRGYISSALKGALLVREATDARIAAEKADAIKTRLLANVSHELRTPLHIILENAAAMLESWTLPQELHGGMNHIQQSAEHQLRLINDLLDLSRAEIDELDLYPVQLDPAPLLRETFESLAPPNHISSAPNGATIHWQLQVPDSLPHILVDPVRLRQILLNLLANAEKHTTQGTITLGAQVSAAHPAPPHLHIWVADTGSGIPHDQVDHIFDPFVTGESARAPAHLRRSELRGGIGLGLSITRQLVALHKGTLHVESTTPRETAPSQIAPSGATFHVRLPLPSVSEQMRLPASEGEPLLLVISSATALAAEILAFSQQQTLRVQQVRAGDDVDKLLASANPAALAWDMVGATQGEWLLLRRLRQHPRFSTLPFILFGHATHDKEEQSEKAQHETSQTSAPPTTDEVGLTSFLPKSSSIEALLENMRATLTRDPSAAQPSEAGVVLVVDDDPAIRQRHAAVVASALPDHAIALAEDGIAAIHWMQGALQNEHACPSLVLLDLMMPGLEGIDVLDWMRSQPRLRQTPVLVLSSRLLTLDDVRRLEHHANVVFQSKGVLSEAETIATVRRVLVDENALPVHTSALVKRAIAFLHQNYSRAIARWELAEAANVSEDYLSRVFNREIGLSPWEYLNRYRIWQARELLERTNDGINAVARQVGFHDQRYFARVFRKVTSMGPQEYREASRA